jgi:hypothetical protein
LTQLFLQQNRQEKKDKYGSFPPTNDAIAPANDVGNGQGEGNKRANAGFTGTDA